jgi:hypothetical protein
MLAFLVANLGTILVSLLLLAVVTAVILKLVHDSRRGKATCGCDCAHCAMHGSCHGK